MPSCPVNGRSCVVINTRQTATGDDLSVCVHLSLAVDMQRDGHFQRLTERRGASIGWNVSAKTLPMRGTNP
jgi:hypothetical protein